MRKIWMKTDDNNEEDDNDDAEYKNSEYDHDRQTNEYGWWRTYIRYISTTVYYSKTHLIDSPDTWIK